MKQLQTYNVRRFLPTHIGKTLAIVLLALCPQVHAQTLAPLFAEIEQRNPELRKYAARCEASKLEARSGLYLPDPEVEFAYLWGKPGEIGNRKDFSISQTFDFATLFGSRRREARGMAELADVEYVQACNLVYFSAQQMVIDLVSTNRRLATLRERDSVAARISESYDRMLLQGEVSKIERNRICLARLSIEAEIRSAQIERQETQAKLAALFGHASIIDAMPETLAKWSNATEYPSEYLNGDQSVLVAERNVELAERQERTSHSENLPDISVGYMSEETVGEKFRGVKFGMSFPLWKARNNVSRAKANKLLAVAERDEQQAAVEAQRVVLKQRIQSLQETEKAFRSSLACLDSTPLMRKALECGEISFVDYLAEREVYYDIEDKLASTLHDLNTAIASLAFIEK